MAILYKAKILKGFPFAEKPFKSKIQLTNKSICPKLTKISLLNFYFKVKSRLFTSHVAGQGKVKS